MKMQLTKVTQRALGIELIWKSASLTCTSLEFSP